MAEGLNLTLVGVSVVFAALIALSFIIFAVSKIIEGLFSNNKPKEVANVRTDEPKQDNPVQRSTPQPVAGGSEDELVAILTAAIYASLGSNYESKIRVKSFKRIPNAAPKWNAAGLSEHVAGKL